MIIDRFANCLTAIEYPKKKTSWNIAGILKDKNAFYKFDVRETFKLPDGNFAQTGKTNTQADKMVFENENTWTIIDIEELHKHIKKTKLKKFYLKDLIAELDWTICINKTHLH